MLTEYDLKDLKKAKVLLERNRITVKAAAVFGDLAEKLVRLFPRTTQRHLEDACLVGLKKSWEFSITTLAPPGTPSAPEKFHRQYALVSGAIGGIGVATLFAELPVTTVIMMRAVADIAKNEGEDFRQLETQIACLQVFALGGVDIAEKHCHVTKYYASRSLLSQPINQSARHIAKKGAAGMGAPFAAQLVVKITAYYQTWLSARTTAAAVPLAGAGMGAGINLIYLNYLREMARGHFIVRRLEKKYGSELVEREYTALQCEDGKKENQQSPPSQHQAEAIIKKHAYAALGGGLLPVPLVDFILITGIQLNLLKKLSAHYHVPFSKNITKNLIGILIGGTFSSTCGVRLGASLAKFTPMIAHPAFIATVSISAGASTYALGKVFNRHFAQGGTLLTFNPKAAKSFYAKIFAEGKNKLRTPAPI